MVLHHFQYSGLVMILFVNKFGRIIQLTNRGTIDGGRKLIFEMKKIAVINNG